MPNITEQETFWRGEFGDGYTDRNRGPGCIAANVAFFGKVLDRTQAVRSVLELGSNIGLNLMALRQLLPGSTFSAVEINEKAGSELQENLPEIDLHILVDYGFVYHRDPNFPQDDMTWFLMEKR